MGSRITKPVLSSTDIEALALSSGKNPHEVHNKFHKFLQENPNGKMSKKVFKDLMNEAMPKEAIGKMEDHMFRLYDTNNDGFIDFGEFLLIFCSMSEGSADDIFTRIFRAFDVNGDGIISKNEMKRLVDDMYELIISDGDEPNQTIKDMIVKGVFGEMDKNEDGKICMEEFVAACIAQEKFSKLVALNVINLFIVPRSILC